MKVSFVDKNALADAAIDLIAYTENAHVRRMGVDAGEVSHHWFDLDDEADRMACPVPAQRPNAMVLITVMSGLPRGWRSRRSLT